MRWFNASFLYFNFYEAFIYLHLISTAKLEFVTLITKKLIVNPICNIVSIIEQLAEGEGDLRLRVEKNQMMK